MTYRLGLDVGTASIALIAVRLDAKGNPAEIIYHSDRIFEEPLDPGKKGGVGEAKKARRRRARLARKLIDRRAGRLRAIADLCRLIGLDPTSVPPDSGQDIHHLRADAVSNPISLPDLIRVLLRMSKRRGYAGGFRTRREDQEEGKVEGGISQLKKAMTEAGCEYLGQYLNHRFQKGQTLKLKNVGLYAERAMLEAEFDRMWDVQSKALPVLSGSRNGRTLHDIFRQTLFHQRPLKSVAPMVGNCQLEPSLPRAPMAQPAMQAFRIEKQIGDLRWGSGRRSALLTSEQKAVIRNLLAEKETVKFDAIYKGLKNAGCHDSQDRTFNTNRFSRQELRGDSTNTAFRALDRKIEKRTGQASNLFESWQALSPGTQISVINFLADLGSPQEVDRPDWHLQYRKKVVKKDKDTGNKKRELVPRSLNQEMVAFINQMVESGEFDRLGKMGFDGGRAAYSVKALNRLTAKMREGLDEDKAVVAIYGTRNKVTGEIKRRLELHAPTGNTVVDVALRELWREVNKMLDVLKEPPAEIIVELTRDMGLGVNRRREIEINIAKNQRERKRAAEELAEHGYAVTASNIHRYLLWEEQETNCPYCGKKLGLSDAVDGNITNRDHIVPKSLTRVGRQSAHLVLAHRSCNDEKNDRTPWQAWGSDPERWALIEAHAKLLKDKKKFTKARLLTLKDYEAEVLDDEAIEGFSARQFHETSWIAKLAAQWLRTICLDVSVSRGALTAYLRRIWGLDTVIPQVRYEEGLPVLDTDKQPVSKEDFNRYRRYWEGHDRGAAGVEMTDRRLEKRIDHRHHVIDALVTAMTWRELFRRMARNYKALAERRNAGERVRPTLAEKPPIPDIREQALEMVRHCNLTHKPDRFPAGAFFQGTAYRKIEMDDGKTRLTVRAKLIELTDKSFSLEKARKGIDDIVSPETRQIVSDEFECRIKRGKSVKDALEGPIRDTRYDPRNGKQATPIFITKVRIYYRIGQHLANGDNAYRIEHKRRDAETLHKYYLSDGYAYVALQLEQGNLSSAKSFPLHAASHRPAAPDSGEIRFYPNDTLFDAESNRRYVVRQIKADATLILALITEAREVDDLDANSGRKKVSGRRLLKLEHV